MSNFLKAVLPQELVKATVLNPRTTLVYSDFKTGKTTIAGWVSRNYYGLLLDYEDGSEADDSYRINVVRKVKELNSKIEDSTKRWSRVGFLMKLASELAAAEPKPYDFIFHDKLDTLEDWCEMWATAEFKASIIGKNFGGNSILEMPDGAGYRYLREKFLILWNAMKDAAPHHIFLSSMRVNRYSGKQGNEFTSRDLDLSKGVRKIAAGECDAPAYLYVADDGSRWLSFRSAEKGVFAGNRIKRLEGKQIKLSWLDENDQLVVDWEKIFVGARRRVAA